MKKAALLAVVLCSALSLSSMSWGATFVVTPTSDSDCSDLDCNLQSALNAAAQNGEDDTVTIAAGTYVVSTSYSPVNGENYSLTVQGAGAGLTVLDGGGTSQIMVMYTWNLANDSNAHITIVGITFLNGNESNVGGGLEVQTDAADISVGNCEFNGNTAGDGGGGVFAFSDYGAIAITDNTFSSNVVSTYSGGGASVFSGSGMVTITGNTFSGNTAGDDAGGVYAFSDSGEVMITGNTFNGNSSSDEGGAVFAQSLKSGEFTFTDNTFIGNSAWDGGAVNAESEAGKVTFSGNTFTGNSAAGGGGGANAESREGTVTVENNTFSGNSATDDTGGGLFAESDTGTVVITGNTFSGNLTPVWGGGATAFSENGTVIIMDNILTGNSALGGGGIAVGTQDGTVNLSRNTFSGNSASTMGGGLAGFAYKGTLTLANNAFGGNDAYQGGGAAVADYLEVFGDIVKGAGTLVLTNNTFNSNSASGVGGGLLVTLYYNKSKAKVFNNIVWNNSAASGSDIYVIDDGNGDNTGSTADFFNNDFSGFYSQCENTGSCIDATRRKNNIDLDPLYADVSDPDPGNWDLHLTGISPCIDGGNNGAKGVLPEDFEGDTRVIDGDQDGIDVVDIGMDEYIPVTFAHVTLISPNGREIIPSGSIHSIQWGAPADAVDFNLKYSLNNGNTWKPIAGGIAGTSHDWTVPAPPKNTSTCLVKVIGYDTNGIKVGADRSYAPFTIGVVKLDTPDGGEVLITGETHTIAWSTNTTKKLVDSVKLLFSQDSGNTWKGLATLTEDADSYGWTVPYLGKNRTRCRVKVVLKDEGGKTIGADTSDGDFSIKVLGIISPNGGEVLSSGSTSSIFWYKGGTETPVDEQKLFYTINGGKTWNPIVTLPGDRVSHPWQVPTVSKIKEKCKVKIILRDAEGNKVGSEASDGYFTIEPTTP